MSNSQIGSPTLVGVFIAGGLVSKFSPGSPYYIVSLTGIALLFILFAYDGDEYRSAARSIAFSAAGGFALMLASTAVLAHFAAIDGEALPALIWVGGTFLLTLVDRARMSGRVQQPARPPASISFSSPSFAPAPVAPTPETVQSASTPEAVSPVPVNPTPPPPPIPANSIPANAIPTKPGRPPKEVTIYVGLVGEGLNVMRPVLAHDLGRNYYLIVETMPEGETWEFTTGQVVRCQKKNLSTGKGLVATEEAPRA